MGMCYHKNNSIHPDSSNQIADSSFYLTNNEKNLEKYIFSLHYYAMTELELKQLSKDLVKRDDIKPTLQKHLEQILKLKEDINNPYSNISEKIKKYQKSNKIFFFEVTNISMKKLKVANNLSMQIKISAGKIYQFYADVNINDYFWFTEELFFEILDFDQKLLIQIQLGDYTASIQSTDLNKYLLPVCQSANLRQKGVLQFMGKIFFRSQFITNIDQFQQKLLDHLRSREKYIKHVLSASDQMEIKQLLSQNNSFIQEDQQI